MLKLSNQRYHYYAIILPVSSLIDVIFLLLFYFLLTLNFVEDHGIDLQLPEANQATPHTPEGLVIDILSSGEIRIGSEKTSFALLPLTLMGCQHPKQKPVLLRADRRTPFENVVKVMDVLKNCGYSQIIIASEKEVIQK